MKRFSFSGSLDSLLYSPEEKQQQPNNRIEYSNEFQAMLDGLDEEDSTEESSQSSEKKRRLSIDQVKALEKIFEVDNKLDPDRKAKLAQELGLQQRQVAIWFQNRRARWKTKQLERDYNHLKANYESLKINYDKLEQEKEAFTTQLSELKSKLPKEHKENNHSNKEEAHFLGYQNNVLGQSDDSPNGLCCKPRSTKQSLEVCSNINFLEAKGLLDFKDKPLDNNSNGFLNEENNLNVHQLISPALSSSRFDSSSLSSSSMMNYSRFSDSRGISTRGYQIQQQFGKVEDHQISLFSTEESSNIFCVDQVPTLYKYFANV